MADVVSIFKKIDKDEDENLTEFEKIQLKNKRNKERLEKDRRAYNEKTKREFRLKRTK